MTGPWLSIITPTLLRPTLQRTCESVDSQSSSYEHIVIIDIPTPEITPGQWELIQRVRHPRRRWLVCSRRHRDWGHSCRRNAVQAAFGTYLLYLDDDDYLASSTSLSRLAPVHMPWAIFPVEREGNFFFHDPPGRCRTTLSSFIVRRELGMLPEPRLDYTPEQHYQLDADLIEHLTRTQPYQTIALDQCIVIIPKPGLGEP